MRLPSTSQISSHAKCGSYKLFIMNLILIAGLTSSTCALAKTPKLWSGSAAFGYSSVTGT